VVLVRFLPGPQPKTGGDGNGGPVGQGQPTGQAGPVASLNGWSAVQLPGPQPGPRAVALSPDGRMLAVATNERVSPNGPPAAVQLWEVPGRKAWGPAFRHDSEVHCVAFSPDGQTLAYGTMAGDVFLLNVAAATPARLSSFAVKKPGVNALVFSANSDLLAVAGGGDDVEMWELFNKEAPRSARRYPGHVGPVTALAASRNRIWLASGGADGTVRVRKFLGGREDVLKPKWPCNAIGALAFSPQGDFLAAVTNGWPDNPRRSEVLVWETATWKPQATAPVLHDWNFGSVTFTPDGSRLITGDADGDFRTWSVSPLAPMGQRHWGPGWVGSLAFGPDGTLVASLEGDTPGDAVALWSVGPR
jgi:WD40 repeat protein